MTLETAEFPSSQNRRSYIARLSLLFAVMIAILAMIGIRIWQTSNRFVEENDWVTHTLEVQNHTEIALARIGMLQAAAIVYATTGAPLRLAEFTKESPKLDHDLHTLGHLIADNPSQATRAEEFGSAALARRDLLAQAVAARQQSNTVPPLPADAADDIRASAAKILAVEDKLLLQRRSDANYTVMLTRMLTTIAVLLSTAFLVFTFWMTRGTYVRQLHDAQTLRDSHEQLRNALHETQRLSDSMQRLAQFGEMLQSCRSMDEIRTGVPTALDGLLPDIGGRLALLNPSQNLLAIGAHWGRHGLIAESVFAPEDCWALRRGQAYPLAGASGGFVCKHVQWPNLDEPDASYVCVPMAAQGEMLGVLTFDAVRALDSTERRLGVAASEQLALALANLRMQDTLRTQSIRDPLTGLFNRRYLEVSLERELSRAERRSQPLAVLMLDLDNFKRFNDAHGHEAGDAVLAQFAEVLKRCTRAEDIACRYGGEEFTVILLEANADIARKRAEQVRGAISEMSVKHRGQQLAHITVSIGYAMFPRDGTTAEDLMRRADTALYLAKKAGRNRIATAEEEEAPDSNQPV